MIAAGPDGPAYRDLSRQHDQHPGGWCSALFPTSWARLEREGGPGVARAMQQELEQTVPDTGRN